MKRLEKVFNESVSKATELYLRRSTNFACYFFWYQPVIPEKVLKRFKK